MIKTQIVGYLGNNAVVNNVNGKRVINFSVASTKFIKGENESNNKEITTWISCNFWSETSKVDEHLKKGSMVYVDGEMTAKPYQDKNQIWDVHINLTVKDLQLLKKANTNS
jgi:single-strand DNA-binding protein